MTTASEKTALIVLGMHRSGTSALAGVLGQLGVTLPADLMDAAEMNAKGFFESNRITGLNERLLAKAGFTWWDPRRFPAAWFDGPDAEALLEEAVAALQDDYGDAPLFVIKDPRICRLMPFWLRALERFGARVRIVHTHRGPWDVAASLTRWADYETEFGLLLWARHVLDAEAESRGLPRSFTSYDALMGDWRAVVEGIAADLALDWPRAPAEAAADIDDFLSRDLQHFRAASPTGPDGQVLPPMLARIEAILQAWTEGGDPAAGQDGLDRLRAAMDATGPLFDPLALRSVHRAREVREATARMTRMQAAQVEAAARAVADREALTARIADQQALLTRAGRDGAQQQATIAELSGRVQALDGRLHVAQVQLRQLSEQRAREMQERMALAIALEDPEAMSDRLSALTARVERATAALRAEERRLRAESDRRAAEDEALRQRLAAAETALRDADAARREAEDSGRRREAELLASTSWRVTAPLRLLSRGVRGLRR
ncbi:sulfotransferase [Paracoccus sp. ME4]|uniref:sulfotransferase family protein n=1 Tax=Paracoccus sp. ME4 TaxID=3138066 RepID=UPI00398B4C26